MGKVYNFNGDIYEVKLPDEYGYGYVKFIDSLKEFKEYSIPPILLFYKNHFTSSISSSSKLSPDLLIAPKIISGSNGIYKMGWKKIGNEPITETEKWLPDVKSGWPPLIENPVEWVYFKNIGADTIPVKSTFENIKHLDWRGGINIETVPFRIYFELLRKEEKELRIDYPFNFFEKAEYKRIIDLPVYSTLPDNIKGKAIK